MPAVLLSRGDSIGGYRLLESLPGSGRLGIHLAEDLVAGGRVVLKIAPLDSAEDVRRLEAERDVMHAVAGPGVAPWLGFGISARQGLAYLAFAVWGPPRGARLGGAGGGRSPPARAGAAGGAAAAALASLHARGWCHGDVKPGNVLLDGSGAAALADLEFARPVGGDPGEEGWSAFAGTIPFIAPELWARGGRATAPAADVWSLGVTLYLAVTGEYPFGSGDPVAVAAAVTRGRLPTSAERLPGPVDHVLRELLAVDPAVRPADGRRAAALLAEAFPGLGLDPARARLRLGQAVKALPLYTTLLGPPTVEAPLPGPPPPPAARPEAKPAARQAEYLEIQTSVIGPAEAGSVADAVRSAGGEPAEGLRRRAAARWFTRMNPSRNFPLTVVLSGRKIKVLDARGMKVSVGTRDIVVDAEHPLLEVEPSFPGCLIMPPSAAVDVSEETTVTRFWITPLSEGEIPEACVRIRHRGRIVETLPTPASVVARTWAKLCLGLSALSPVLAQVFEGLGWTPATEIREGFPVVGWLFRTLGPAAGVLLLAGAFLLASVVLYRVTRPVASEPEPALTA